MPSATQPASNLTLENNVHRFLLAVESCSTFRERASRAEFRPYRRVVVGDLNRFRASHRATRVSDPELIELRAVPLNDGDAA